MTDSNVEEQVQSIKKKIAQAEKEQIRAEHVHDSAKASAAKIRQRLETEFGVKTAEEAKDKLQELETTLESVLNKAQLALSEVN